MPRNPKIKFDTTKIYFGKPYTIDLDDSVGSITVYSPTIGDIIEMGEERFFQTLNIFITNTTQYRLDLWDAGIDWTEISDFDLFVFFYKRIDPEPAKLLFGDLDFSKFEIMYKKIDNEETESEDIEESKGEVALYDRENKIEINYNVYNHISQYLQNVFGIFPEEKITKSQHLKQMYIEKDRRERKNKEWKEEHNKEEARPTLQSTISACVNHPGFKYKLKELEEVGVAEFYDSVRRLMTYEQSTALMKGMYSGFVDGSKIKPKDYDFMRDMYDNK